MIQDLESKHSLHYAAESSSQTAHECVQLIIKKNKRLLDIKVKKGRWGREGESRGVGC